MATQIKRDTDDFGVSLVTESLGWVGTVLILVAYCLVSLGQLDGDSPIYLVLNLVGSVGVGVDAFSDRNLQPVVLNIVWGIVALIGLITFFT